MHNYIYNLGWRTLIPSILKDISPFLRLMIASLSLAHSNPKRVRSVSFSSTILRTLKSATVCTSPRFTSTLSKQPMGYILYLFASGNWTGEKTKCCLPIISHDFLGRMLMSDPSSSLTLWISYPWNYASILGTMHPS
uniref:Uncharacterized protein n=1 Tax=Picea glauca TaxID=3330 RepID=A0A117NJB7_PICGL|nr:hypothetical protein ABT39_MTgene1107 [Picea glauca]